MVDVMETISISNAFLSKETMLIMDHFVRSHTKPITSHYNVSSIFIIIFSYVVTNSKNILHPDVKTQSSWFRVVQPQRCETVKKPDRE